MANKAETRRINIYINDEDAGKSIKNIKSEARKLNRVIERELTPGTAEYEQAVKRLSELKGTLSNHREQIRGVKSGWESIKESINPIGTLTVVAMAGAAATAVVAMGKHLAAVSKEYMNLRREIKQTSDLVGAELASVTVQSIALSRTFGDDASEVFKVANSVANEMKISIGEALQIIEKGYIAGGNANGEMLEQIREYIPVAKEIGIGAEGLTAQIVKASKSGEFSDYGIAAIEEAQLRLREMPKATADALQKIGITSQEIKKIIAEDGIGGAIEAVSKQMALFENDSQETGTALAGIFGASGEKVGVDYILSLKELGGNLDDLIDETDGLTIAQINNLNAQKELAFQEERMSEATQEIFDKTQTLGTQLKAVFLSLLISAIQNVKSFVNGIMNLTKFMKENMNIVVAITTVIAAMNVATITATASKIASSLASKRKTVAIIAETVATNVAVGVIRAVIFAETAYTTVKGLLTGKIKVATIAQRVFNLAMRMNPIGLVITAVGLLIAGFITLYKRSETVRNAVDAIAKAAKEAWESIKNLFKSEETLQKEKEALSKSRINKQKKDADERRKKELSELNKQETEKRKIEEEKQKAAAAAAITKANELRQRLKSEAETARKEAEKAAEDAIKEAERKATEAAEKLKQRLEKLNKDIAALQKANELDGLTGQEKEIRQIEIQFETKIDEATEIQATAQLAQLEQLKLEAIQKVKDDFAAKEAEKTAAEKLKKDEADAALLIKDAEERAALQETIRAETGTALENELADLEASHRELTAAAEKYGIDTTALTEKYEAEKAAIEDKFKEEGLAKYGELFDNVTNSFSSLIDAFGNQSEAAIAFQKGIALAQIGFDTAKAISGVIAAAASTSITPIDLAVKIAAGLGTVFANIASAKKTIGETKVPQRFTGGMHNVKGATDGKSYAAQYLGSSTKTGMLPSGPKLILANENGSEYFVDANTVRNPLAFNHIAALEVLAGRQMQTGGLTADIKDSSSGQNTEVLIALKLSVDKLTVILEKPISASVALNDDTLLDIKNRTKRIDSNLE